MLTIINSILTTNQINVINVPFELDPISMDSGAPTSWWLPLRVATPKPGGSVAQSAQSWTFGRPKVHIPIRSTMDGWKKFVWMVVIISDL